MKPEYLTESQVSELTGIAVQTLRNHRTRREGFPYVKAGRSVRYQITDVRQFMDEHRIDTQK